MECDKSEILNAMCRSFFFRLNQENLYKRISLNNCEYQKYVACKGSNPREVTRVSSFLFNIQNRIYVFFCF